MNCDAMLVRMLDAEPGELAGKGQSPVARHIRTCRKCGAVAGQLLAGTASLRPTVAPIPAKVLATPMRRRQVRWAGAAVTSLAASLVIFLLVQGLPRSATLPDPLRREPARGQGGDVAQQVPVERVPVISQRAVAPQRFADAVPVLPTAAVPAGLANTALNDSGPAIVTVDPPSGTRAAILRTTNPGITVVWLY